MDRLRGSIAVRLLALGLAQVIVIAIAAIVISRVTRPAPHPEDVHAHVASAAERIARAEDATLAAELARAAGELHLELTVIDADDRVLASTVEPPLARGMAPPDRGPAPLPLLGPPPAPRRVLTAALPDGRTLLARGAGPPAPWLAPLLTLIAGLLVIGAGAILTGRWIVRPLETLAASARALGEGDLRARTGLARRDEIGRVARSFDEMADRIQVLVRAERELLANVSHELRTPLARIRVAMDLASEGDAEAGRAALAEIATDLAELESIVDDILVAMRFEVGGETAKAGLPLSSLAEVPAGALAERAIERFRARHPERPLVLDLRPEAPPVIVDPILFRRVVDNLLENAHKYSPDPASPITLRVVAREPGTSFEVIDRGIGIAEQDLANVFTPFFRVERSRTRGAGGVGLGLTLAKRIVEAHGGTIDVESQLGRGTTVRVTLDSRA